MFGKKSKRILPDNPCEPDEITVVLNFTVRARKDSYNHNNVVDLKVEKNLILNSDAPIDDIKEEIEKIVATTWKEAEERLDVTPYLTDGYFKRKKEEEFN